MNQAKKLFDEIAEHLRVRRNNWKYKENLKRFTEIKNNLPKYNTKLTDEKKELLTLPYPVYRAREEMAEITLLGALTPTEMADIVCCAEEYPSLFQALYIGNSYLEQRKEKLFYNAEIMNITDLATQWFGQLNISFFDLLYHRSKNAIIEFTDQIVEQIIHTDIGLDIPATYIKNINEKGCYLQFGTGTVNDLPVVMGPEDHDPVEGVYIFENIYSEFELAAFCAENEIPTCKRHIMFRFISDSTASPVNLYIQNDEMSVQEVLEFSDKVTKSKTNLPLVELVTKALLYLNVVEYRKENVFEKTALLQRGKGKEKQYRNKLAAAYDRIVIRPPVEDNTENSEAIPRGGKKPHYRRGHIRMAAYGEGRTLRRPVFIKPMLINKDKIGSTPPTMKNYVVKK